MSHGAQGSPWGPWSWGRRGLFLEGGVWPTMSTLSEWLHFYLLQVLGLQMLLFEKKFLVPQNVEVFSL